MLLAGDVGGTHTRLAAYRLGDGQNLASWWRPDPAAVVPLAEAVYPSHDHPGLEAIVQVFVEAHNLAPTHAGFGVAGPVVHGRAAVTNLPWVVVRTHGRRYHELRALLRWGHEAIMTTRNTARLRLQSGGCRRLEVAFSKRHVKNETMPHGDAP